MVTSTNYHKARRVPRFGTHDVHTIVTICGTPSQTTILMSKLTSMASTIPLQGQHHQPSLHLQQSKPNEPRIDLHASQERKPGTHYLPQHSNEQFLFFISNHGDERIRDSCASFEVLAGGESG